MGKLPATGKADDTKEEDCPEGMDGKITFTCDADAKRWTLSDHTCEKPEEPAPLCKKTNYRVKFGDKKLVFPLPAAMEETERVEDSDHCPPGKSGKMTFACQEK